MLALIPIDRIDLSAIPQPTRGFCRWASPRGAGRDRRDAATASRNGVTFAGNTPPMVAGWDGLLPQWFTRVHPRYKTPVNSIVFVGAATLALSIAGLIGVGKQEAFQLLWNASAIFYAITYLVMFAIPLVGLRGRGTPAPFWLKGCALSGFLMTLLFVAL